MGHMNKLGDLIRTKHGVWVLHMYL